MEGTWTHAKRAMPALNRIRKFFVGYLATFMLKRKWANQINGSECFMKAAAQLYKNKKETEHLYPSDFAGDEEDDGESLEPCVFNEGNQDYLLQTPTQLVQE